LEELTRADWDDLAAEAGRVYACNEVDITDDYFHMPNREFYPSMFAWDSAYHAVTMLHIDPEKSKRELETLFRQVSADGHMPHEMLIQCPATRAQTMRNLMRWMARRHYDPQGASRLVDPPIYVYAALLVFQGTGDRQWLARIWKNLCRCLDYLLDERDLFGDGLVSILHPWESGTDLSPQLLPALGIDPSRRRDWLQAGTYAVLLDRFCNRFNWNPAALKDENRFVVEDLTINCITIRALDSAAALAKHIGDENAARRFSSHAAKMAEAIENICWDESAGCYFPRWDVRAPRLARAKTAASLLPLFTGRCEPARADRLIAEHLVDPGEFWTEYLLPFNAHDELASARRWIEDKLWCGHCIWINFNWMIAIALVENGRAAQARELTSRTVSMILREGFWEYYDSRTGAGKRIRDFNWPGLALDMISRCAYPL
jgi:Mannosylglycerate hydrolase MGH1-like glycoside hydrolase domain